VRIGEGEVAPDRADVADPHVGHVAGDRAHEGTAGLDQHGLLHGAMRDGSAEPEASAVLGRESDLAESTNALDVDEMARAKQAKLHQEQELGTARVDGGVLAQAGQERARLLGGLGAMKRERPEHGQRPSAAAGRTISSAIIRRYSMRAFASRGRL